MWSWTAFESVFFHSQVATADADSKKRGTSKPQNSDDKISEENEPDDEDKSKKDSQNSGEPDGDEDDEMTETVTTSYKAQVVGPIKESPLERRALMSLEKQLELEVPDSKFDLRVSFSFNLRMC